MTPSPRPAESTAAEASADAVSADPASAHPVSAVSVSTDPAQVVRTDSHAALHGPESGPETGLDAGVPQSSGLRMLAVHAHPDDESSKGAAMMAAYAAAGAQVMVATATGGEAGDLLNPAAESPHSDRDLTGLRRLEMAEAIEALGVEHVWLGFTDSGLPDGDPMPPLPFGTFATLPIEQATAPLVRLIRRFRPHVLISYDENGGYPHPDHIMSHRICLEAWERSGDGSFYPDAGEPWEPLKLYYDRAFNLARFRAIHEAMVEAGMESPFGERLRRFEDGDMPWRASHETTTQVPIGAFLEHRDRALLAHRTQVAPDSFFFATPNDLIRKIWPFDDYVLIESRVPVQTPEDDLFSGVRRMASPQDLL